METNTPGADAEGEQRGEAIREALSRALPSWRLIHGPEPYGWAPSRHLRATLAGQGRTVNVVIRKSWSREGHDVELFLYTTILPHLTVDTAALIAEFELGDGEPGWLVLEDLGGEQARANNREHRGAYLRALGKLHAEGRTLVQRGLLAGLRRFTADASDMSRWRTLLARAIGQGEFGVDEQVIATLDLLRERMTEGIEAVETLLHGDTDFSNAVIRADGAALVDWEKATIGPPSLDLGAMIETLESGDELAAYRQGVADGGGASLTAAQVGQWALDGETYNCLRWICYYIQAASEGAAPSAAWRRRFYDPCLRRLREIAERRAIAPD
jgi:hypothetical protein